MTLSATLQQKLADWRPTHANETLTATEGGWTVTVQAERCETLGCLVRELTLRPTATEADDSSLKAWAERIATRVTGLLEPLRLLEVDDHKRSAVLRSHEPARRDDELYYYELLLDGNTSTANLQRYRASRQPSVRREPTGFALTHEALAKVVGDIADSRS